ncbi:MAG: transposase family protein, partial [Erysipelotrichales bacterium]
MHNSNSIKNLLNIKDKNIFLDDIPVLNMFIKGIDSKVVSGFLAYKPDVCPCCGTVHPKLYSKGFSRPSYIRIPNVSNMNAYLRLRKKRYKCLECNHSFTLTSNIVKPNCFISIYTKTSIALSLA